MRILLSIFAVAMLIAGGCRREDVREVTIEIKGLDSANRAKVVQALKKYGGVRQDSYKWDIPSGTVTLSYDSMQVAQTNLRMAIEAAGLEVVYPEKAPGSKAGH
ncbi:MAG: hypothetical protein J6W80_05605 [Kiritimatiellae bacterium]|nr:hypothetical protein [Kiritimatiellia bacterium]